MTTEAQLNTRFNMTGLNEALQKIESISPSIASAIRQAGLLNETLSSGDILKNARARLDNENRRLRTQLQLNTALGEQGAEQAKIVAAELQANSQAREKLANEIAVNTALERQGKLQAQAAAEAVRMANAARISANQSRQKGASTNRFFVGNITQQFQDVAVTAAMGMSALQIGLQQGTQIAAVLALMEKPLPAIVTGFKNLFSATSLLTIGLVSGVAALIQWVDWTKVLTVSAEFLSKNMTATAFAIAGVSAVTMTAIAAYKAYTQTTVVTAGAIRIFGLAFDGLNKKMLIGAAAILVVTTALKGFGILDTLSEKVKSFADNMASVGDANEKAAVTFDDVLKKAREANRDVWQQGEAFYYAGQALKDFNHEQELRNMIQDNNLKLSPKQQAALLEEIKKYHELGEQITRTQAPIKFLEQSTSTLFSQMKTDLQSGLSAWDAFGNGVGKILDNMLDKLLAFGTNQIFNSVIKPSLGASGGIGGTVGAAISSVFGFENGGIMTSRGSLPLNRYASGGIANSPQLAMFGEGRTPEAYVPLPDGRSIPVSMTGSNSNDKPVVNVVVEVNGNAEVQQRTSTGADGSETRRFIINTVSEGMASGQMDGALAGRFGVSPRRTSR